MWHESTLRSKVEVNCHYNISTYLTGSGRNKEMTKSLTDQWGRFPSFDAT